MTIPRLYLVCGMCGAGKTTYAKSFAHENGFRYVNPDDFYALYNGDERIHIHGFDVWMSVFRVLHLCETDGISVVLDTNALTVTDRTQFLDWFPEFEHHLIFIDAPIDMCRANNAKRDRRISDLEFDRMVKFFQPPTVHEDQRWVSFRRIAVSEICSDCSFVSHICPHAESGECPVSPYGVKEKQ